MKAGVKAKLASVQGDTLVEALAALLIAAMGAALLATMVMASMNITVTNQKNLEANYQAEQTMGKVGFREAVTITMGTATATPGVQVYQSDDGTFTRYENNTPRPGVAP